MAMEAQVIYRKEKKRMRGVYPWENLSFCEEGSGREKGDRNGTAEGAPTE